MGWGLFKVLTFTMGATSGSASVNLGRGYRVVYLQVPTMPSASALDVYASPDGVQTYYQVRHYPNPLTATVLAPSFIVSAGAGANGALVPLPAGLQYYKLIPTDSTPTASLGFQVLCGQ